MRPRAQGGRPAAGSAMVDAGASLPPPVRDILGHSSVAITADVYSHPGRSLMSAASSCHTSF